MHHTPGLRNHTHTRKSARIFNCEGGRPTQKRIRRREKEERGGSKNLDINILEQETKQTTYINFFHLYSFSIVSCIMIFFLSLNYKQHDFNKLTNLNKHAGSVFAINRLNISKRNKIIICLNEQSLLSVKRVIICKKLQNQKWENKQWEGKKWNKIKKNYYRSTNQFNVFFFSLSILSRSTTSYDMTINKELHSLTVHSDSLYQQFLPNFRLVSIHFIKL